MLQLILAAALTEPTQHNYSTAMKSGKIPGMQVVVVDHGKVILDDALGVKNVLTQAPVDVHTRFEIGSITKQFTAAAILQLRERGKLSLDDVLSKYVPQYVRGRKITLRQMLLQISGIPDYSETSTFNSLGAYRNGRIVITKRGDLAAVVEIIQGKKLDFTPGTKWEYSNTNYYMLGYIVQRVSGMPWSAYIRQHIFARANMSESSFMQDEPGMADLATGYTRYKNRIDPTGNYAGWAGGAGAIVSTAADLAKWDAALFNGKIISAVDLKLMTSPGPLPALDGNARYGFGWVIDSYDGQARLWHNGGTIGFSASNEVYPKQSQAIVVLSNRESGTDSIAQKTFDTLHPEFVATQNKAAAGEDRAVTARIKITYSSLMSGHLDRAQFTKEAQKGITPDAVAPLKQLVAPMGRAETWVYRGSQEKNGATTYTYRVTFSSGMMLNVYMTLDKNNKIAAYWVSPT